MEPGHGRHIKASKFAPEEQDIISNMPDNVITNILDRLPLRDSLRTGILSRDWRFKWNMLTQLVFEPFPISKNGYTGNDISRLLLHLNGSVTKFVLCMVFSSVFKVEDISLWILFLSRKGIKEFTLINHANYYTPLILPTHFYSCLELKHLKLDHCHFCPPPTFHGFPNLSSLELSYMGSESASVMAFINWCPLLEILIFRSSDPVNKMKPVEIAMFRNLKTLAFPLCMLDSISFTSFDIFQLFGFLPKLQNLDLSFGSCKLVTAAGARNRLPTAFWSLKTLTLSEINLSNGIMLSCGFELICGCPNLQTLKISANNTYDPPPGTTSSEVDYNSMGQFQLRSLVFENLIDADVEVCLIKCLLARSPLLKTVSIHPLDCLQSCDLLTFARKLLKLHRASPKAEIDFY